VDRLMVVRVSIELQPVECDALRADRDLSQVRTDFGIEAIAVHAEVGRGVPEPKEACRISRGTSICSRSSRVDEKLSFVLSVLFSVLRPLEKVSCETRVICPCRS
jgi:hypothetical protein